MLVANQLAWGLGDHGPCFLIFPIPPWYPYCVSWEQLLSNPLDSALRIYPGKMGLRRSTLTCSWANVGLCHRYHHLGPASFLVDFKGSVAVNVSFLSPPSHFLCSSLLSVHFFAFFFLFYLLDIVSRDVTSSFSCPALGTMEEDELIYILGLTDNLENHGFFLSCSLSLVPMMRLGIWVSVWRREIDIWEGGGYIF